MNRIQSTFQRLNSENRTGLIAYVTVGFPEIDATLDLVPTIVDAGADLIELGVPFSDPLADGATIQRASQVALDNGVTLKTCLDTANTLRKGGLVVPLILMGYYNPVLAYGVEEFARDAEEAGVDGLIIPDLPPEEAGPVLAACEGHGVAVVFLLAPTSTAPRIGLASRLGSGFLYCVSLTGVTGARHELPEDLPMFIDRVRAKAKLPLAVGFGVSTAEHVRVIGRQAEAVIVGSALVRVIDEAPIQKRIENVRDFVNELREGTDRGKNR
ncbi:tryptophan synthase subunit alpha [Dehalococcoidia bacterium]|nr:tryptophan synthase subunit alpha [Dehalococcoidia bacterium]